jgi:fatty-acid peroxygenase
MMVEIPRVAGLDDTLALARDGYRFISRRCDRLGTDIFRTRLLLRPTICMRGEHAACLFYDTTRFMRQGAAPGRMRRTLTGTGGVQGLDGPAHRHRKQMLMSIMTPTAIDELARLTDLEWRDSIQRWRHRDPVVLHHETGRLLCRTVCSWAGVPLPDRDVARRTRDLRALIEGPATVGPRYWRIVIVGAGFAGFQAARRLSRLARGRAEIVLVSPTDYFLYLPLLPEVAAGVLEPRRVTVPLACTLTGVRLVLGGVARR